MLDTAATAATKEDWLVSLMALNELERRMAPKALWRRDGRSAVKAEAGLYGSGAASSPFLDAIYAVVKMKPEFASNRR